MQIKLPEKLLRSCLVSIALFALLYLFSFGVQAIFSELRFTNEIFENSGCSTYKAVNNRSIQKNMAFTAWHQYNKEVSEMQYSVLQPSAPSFVNGTLACFCNQESNRIGFLSAALGSYGYMPRQGRMEYDLQAEGQQPICRDYLFSEALYNHYAVISSFTIFLGNILFIYLAQPLVKLIGFSYKTNERVCVSVTIFICLVFNSMVMPILLQANFSQDYSGSFWDWSFSKGGRNSDFGPTWYTDIAG